MGGHYVPAHHFASSFGRIHPFFNGGFPLKLVNAVTLRVLACRDARRSEGEVPLLWATRHQEGKSEALIVMKAGTYSD
jgi:hypothetical protein